MKKIIRSLTVCLVVLVFLPTVAFASKPVVAYILTCTGLPEGTEYVDLLIKLPTTDPCYTPLVAENVPDSFAEDAEIISYCIDNYRSYTFHYNGAISQIAVGDPNGLSYFRNGMDVAHHLDDVKSRGEIKLAMLDASGNIIKVSAPQSLKPKGLFVRITPQLHYNARLDTLDVGKESYFDLVLIIYMIILIIMVVHCVVKWLTARLFRVWILSEKLILITAASTYLFRWSVLLVVAIFCFPVFWIIAGILIVLLFAAELIIYRWKMLGVSFARCLCYTLVSDFLSVIAAILALIIIL